MSSEFRSPARTGFYFALSAYGLWGLLPLFWKTLENVPVLEVLAHRAIWSIPVACIILFAIGRTGDILPTLKDRKKLGILLACSIIISSNWGVFIWAVTNERTLDAALAYYINPLISVCLGALFLGERFNRLQFSAILLATFAVLLLTFTGGEFPWISLFLAGSFAAYGLLRKTVDVGPAQGFLIEILLIAAFAAAYLIWLLANGEASFLSAPSTTMLLVASGPATAVPLILFAAGAKRLRLSTIGLMQFIVPTMLFLIGVFIFREPLNQWQLMAFGLIWLGLVLFSWSALTQGANQKT